MKAEWHLCPGRLTLSELRHLLGGRVHLTVDAHAWPQVEASAAIVAEAAAGQVAAYGINTGFGKLARTQIPKADLQQLQVNLVRSHAVGTGPLLDDETVRLILVLKAASLARGVSGVRRQVIESLLAVCNAGILPCIPSQGSVGASGDLAPLAHMTLSLMGEGEVRVDGRLQHAAEALERAGLEPLQLQAKEGLALLNGTQVSTALALRGLFAAEDVFAAAVVSGAMSVDAARGSDAPFDPRIHEVRGQPGQIEVAEAYRRLLDGSEIRHSHRVDDDRVQDPYSLRCQPQVMGACLDLIRNAAATLLIEANAVTDNPLAFVGEAGGQAEVLSGGNFHAEPVALAADTLALAIAEIGALAERRIALLIDAELSGLPPFLTREPGLHSGFMMAHVTAAALASENKSLAHPASVDSLPTSANQEDHVSMATFAARRLMPMCDNTRRIIAIELLAAAQGIDFRAPLTTAEALHAVHLSLRERVPMLVDDRVLAHDLAKAEHFLATETLTPMVADLLPSWMPE